MITLVCSRADLPSRVPSFRDTCAVCGFGVWRSERSRLAAYRRVICVLCAEREVDDLAPAPVIVKPAPYVGADLADLRRNGSDA